MKTILKRINTTITLLIAAAGIAQAADQPREIRVDYAYYSPPSLVLRKFGWLEQEFKASNIPVKWVFSQGSNRSLEYLNSGSIDFGSTAGLAAVLSKANGNPIKGVYVLSRPEWTALAVRRDSPIRTIADLKGKKVAATKGTDPYLFLLRALHTEGLTKRDIQHVSLQHADGRAALERGKVDAWSGLDPLLAASEIEAGAKLIYRNISFNTYAFLNTSESFATKYPEHVKRVIAAYERARKWIIANPEQTAKIIAQEAKLPLPVARLQLKRNDFLSPVPSAEHINALKSAGSILVEEDLVKKRVNVNRVIDNLIDPSFAKAVVR